MNMQSESKISESTRHFNNMCKFLEKAGFTRAQIIWAMIHVAQDRYKVELLLSK